MLKVDPRGGWAPNLPSNVCSERLLRTLYSSVLVSIFIFSSHLLNFKFLPKDSKISVFLKGNIFEKSLRLTAVDIAYSVTKNDKIINPRAN